MIPNERWFPSPRSVRAVGVCLVIRRYRLFRDAAIATELESGAECPAPYFGRAGLPPRTGDLGAWLPRPCEAVRVRPYPIAPAPLQHQSLAPHPHPPCRPPLALQRPYGTSGRL